ncbi:MAG TPA: FadD3 family acyl-CoA ligase [Streptosporangiaceae bacterium]
MDLTIPAALASASARFGDAIAIAEPGGPRLTYQELHERVQAIAAALAGAGIAAGDRVAVWSPNTHHWVLGALGAQAAGATLVPVNTRFTGAEALDVIGRSGASALLVAGPFLGTDRLAALRAAAAAEPGSLDRLRLAIRVPVTADAPDASPDGPAWGAGADWPGCALLDWAELERRGASPRAAMSAPRMAATDPDDVSDILFTSGTTGQSKGAMSSHRQALEVAGAWAECGQVTRSDNYLVINPFFHSFGYKAGILVCLLTGATIVPQVVYDAEQTMRLIQAERITVLPGAPTIYQTILDHPARGSYDLSSLRLAVTGAAVVPVALVERMQAELSFDTVLTAYGLTEAVVATMCRPGDDPALVARTSGRATAGFEVAIAPTAGPAIQSGHDGPVGPGAESAEVQAAGEILLRGPNVMLGYLDDPAATKEAVDADGWLHTGDVGWLDAGGYLSITDRLKDMYICGGFNVYPAEVEQVLARLDGVAESAVIGVPDERLGEIGKAFVVTRAGRDLTAADVVAHCRGRLANFKVPRQVEFRDSLPRNPSGKPLKRLLREESR